MIRPRQIASVQSANEEEEKKKKKKRSKYQKEITNPDKYRVLSRQNEPVRDTSNSRQRPLRAYR